MKRIIFFGFVVCAFSTLNCSDSESFKTASTFLTNNYPVHFPGKHSNAWFHPISPLKQRSEGQNSFYQRNYHAIGLFSITDMRAKVAPFVDPAKPDKVYLKDQCEVTIESKPKPRTSSLVMLTAAILVGFKYFNIWTQRSK